MSALLPRDTLSIKDLSLLGIRRWRLLFIACLGLCLLTFMAWRSIPRLEDPKVDVSEAGVFIAYPGASPEDVEAQVIKVVEAALYAMEDIEYVESTALPGLAFFHLKFAEGRNMDLTAEQIRGVIQGKKKDLPAEVRDPEVGKFSTVFVVQMVVAVVGNRSDEVLGQAARLVKDSLATIPGVASITLRGDRRHVLRVRLDLERLAAHRLSPGQVAQRLQLNNIRVPAGELRIGSLLTLLQVNQELSDARSVLRVPVGAAGDGNGGTQTVSLGEVAEVKDEIAPAVQRFMFQGQPAVALELRFRPGENAVAVGHAVRDRLADLSATLPAGTALRIAHDQPYFISRSISSFLESLFEGMLLVMLIITLGMGWRSALVVAGVLPLSVGGAVLGLYLLGFSLEQVSIAGLIVALGLLVDDAVVVTESIQIMRDKGLSALRAAVLGTARVFWANNGTTAVACASFLPLFFMGGATGAFIKGLPAAVLLCLGTSLVLAQLFTPWVSTFLLRPAVAVRGIPDDESFDRRQDSAGGTHEEHNPALRALRAVYLRHIEKVVRHPLRVIFVSTLLLISALCLLPRIGFQFFPKADKPILFVTLRLPQGTHRDVTTEKLLAALSLIKDDPAIADTSAMLGAGYPQIFSGRLTQRERQDVADILVRLRPDQRTAATASRLRRRLSDLSGVFVTVEELYHGPPLSHPIVIRLYGDDFGKLRAYAEEVKGRIRALLGTRNVADSLTDTIPLAQVRLDPDRALRVGLSPGQVGTALRLLHGEDKVTQFRLGDETVDVLLETPPTPEGPLQGVERTLLPGMPGMGIEVPLREAGQVDLEYGFAELRRRNTRRIVEITADLEGKVLPEEVIKQLDPWLVRKTWEPGYGFTYAGAQEETQKSFRNLGMAAVGAILLIFLLLVLMFDSLTLSGVVLLAVPYVLMGAVLGLFLTGNPFGFMAFLGLIALIGVYVNHKIYFVDRMQVLMDRGAGLEEAIAHAGRDRLRPVVLTALTAVLGLIPLTLGGGILWSAFGWVNIFGLLFSIPLSLILLPAFIAVAHRLKRGRSPVTGVL